MKTFKDLNVGDKVFVVEDIFLRVAEKLILDIKCDLDSNILKINLNNNIINYKMFEVLKSNNKYISSKTEFGYSIFINKKDALKYLNSIVKSDINELEKQLKQIKNKIKDKKRYYNNFQK